MIKKCHFKDCNEDLYFPPDGGSKFIRIQKSVYTNAKGIKVIDWDGYRPFCEGHTNEIFKKRLPRTLDIVYGKQRKRS